MQKISVPYRFMKLFYHAFKGDDLHQLAHEDLSLGPHDDILPANHCGLDMNAPIVILQKNELSVRRMRWGLPDPSSIQQLRGMLPELIGSNHQRCLVPYSRFAQWHPGRLENIWLKSRGKRPSYFAGYWTHWRGKRQKLTRKKTPTYEDSLWSLFAIAPETSPTFPQTPAWVTLPKLLSGKDECLRWLSGDSVESGQSSGLGSLTAIAA